MTSVTRRIGLSLGADLCWPICYEEILKRLDLKLPVQGDTVSFEVERVTIEPYDLRQKCRYDVVLDRLTHWYSMSREWIKKSVIMDGLYVFNNPWSIQAMEKHTSYCAMMRLGMPVPDTWMVPAKAYEPKPDLQVTLERYAKLFDLAEVGEKVGYPMFMKPYDGGGWKGVSRIDDVHRLYSSYDQSGTNVMHLQHAVEPWDRFVRCIGLGPQTKVVKYDPSQPLHDRYTLETGFVSAEERSLLEDMTLTINAFFGWDFNSCETMHKDGVWHPIDFANACPDSQVTSLHFHFPWLVMANLRWSLFCAATRRPMRLNHDWAPFYEIADSSLSYREKLRQWASIAHQRFDTVAFQQFCDTHLSNLEAETRDFFATDVARDAVRQKVAALYPAHEVETFTDLFWSRIQDWRETTPEPYVTAVVPKAAKAAAVVTMPAPAAPAVVTPEPVKPAAAPTSTAPMPVAAAQAPAAPEAVAPIVEEMTPVTTAAPPAPAAEPKPVAEAKPVTTRPAAAPKAATPKPTANPKSAAATPNPSSKESPTKLPPPRAKAKSVRSASPRKSAAAPTDPDSVDAAIAESVSKAAARAASMAKSLASAADGAQNPRGGTKV